MVSFIIPIYNCEEYINQCIASIISQAIPDFEIILIDDGSTDNSATIIDEYAASDSRIEAFHIDNGGPSRARNIGIEKANGEWVLFVDADDWIDEETLSTLSLSSSSPDITFWGFKKCSKDGVFLEECKPKTFKCSHSEESYSLQLKELLTNHIEYFGYSCNKIYKKSIIEKYQIRFEEDLRTREDEVFALRYCLHANTTETLSFAPYNYRIITNSLSHSSQPKYCNYYRLANVESQILNDYKTSDFVDAFRDKVFHYYINSIIESIRFATPKLEQVIADSTSFYDNHKQNIVTPKWISLMYNFPLRAWRKQIIKMIFSIRNILKK